MTLLAAHGYWLKLRLTPNRATVAGAVSLTLSRDGKPVSGARVRLTFTALDMAMGGLTGLLPETAPGRYSHAGPRLGMSGRWGLRIDVTPPHAASFSLNLVDRMASNAVGLSIGTAIRRGNMLEIRRRTPGRFVLHWQIAPALSGSA